MESAPQTSSFIIVSGVSGSGKTTAIRALEDSGYFCVDNLPATLVESFMGLCQDNSAVTRFALVLDGRGEPFAHDVEDMLRMASGASVEMTLLFLDSKNEVLIRRFSETRRKHPFSREGEPLSEGIRRERAVLEKFKSNASIILDTSQMTVHQLRRTIVEQFGPSTAGRMPIFVTSFGFKYGLPHEAELVFDGRFLSNPHFVPDLRPQSGQDEPVREFILAQAETQTFLAHITSLLDFAIPLHDKEGRARLTIAIGCTGGRHRSVCMAEEIGDHLRRQNLPVTVLHRDIERHRGPN